MNTLQELDSSFGLYLHFALYILANYYGLFTIFCSAAFHARMALFRLLSICHYDDLCTRLFSICLYVFFSLISLFFLHSIAFLFVCLFVYLWGKCSIFFFSSTNFIILPNKCSSEFVDCVIASYLMYMYLCAFQCILSPLLVRKCLYISQHGFSAFLSEALWCVPRI